MRSLFPPKSAEYEWRHCRYCGVAMQGTVLGFGDLCYPSWQCYNCGHEELDIPTKIEVGEAVVQWKCSCVTCKQRKDQLYGNM